MWSPKILERLSCAFTGDTNAMHNRKAAVTRAKVRKETGAFDRVTNRVMEFNNGRDCIMVTSLCYALSICTMLAR